MRSQTLLLFTSIILLMTSCARDWECECMSDTGPDSIWSINDERKKDARDICDQIENAKAGDRGECELRK